MSSHLLSNRDLRLIRGLIAYGSLAKAAENCGMSERHARRLVGAATHRAGVANRYALVAWLVLEGEISRRDVSSEWHRSI